MDITPNHRVFEQEFQQQLSVNYTILNISKNVSDRYFSEFAIYLYSNGVQLVIDNIKGILNSLSGKRVNVKITQYGWTLVIKSKGITTAILLKCFAPVNLFISEDSELCINGITDLIGACIWNVHDTKADNEIKQKLTQNVDKFSLIKEPVMLCPEFWPLIDDESCAFTGQTVSFLVTGSVYNKIDVFIDCDLMLFINQHPEITFADPHNYTKPLIEGLGFFRIEGNINKKVIRVFYDQKGTFIPKLTVFTDLNFKINAKTVKVKITPFSVTVYVLFWDLVALYNKQLFHSSNIVRQKLLSLSRNNLITYAETDKQKNVRNLLFYPRVFYSEIFTNY
jgi:hypothetical protein